MGDPDDMQCYPYGYNGCDSGMTHCNQKQCASSDKKPSKCQKKLIDKNKLHKCRKKKWGRKSARRPAVRRATEEPLSMHPPSSTPRALACCAAVSPHLVRVSHLTERWSSRGTLGS